MNQFTSPFDARSTAADVVRGLDLTGRRAFVTGGAAGIGLEITRALAWAGAEVTVADRDPARGAEVAASLTGNVRHELLDLADVRSVRALTDRWDGPLDVLVANAGVMAIPQRTLSVHGWETQLAVNHLGHHALVTGLHSALRAAGGARVVVLSSSGHLAAPVDLEDLHFERRPYDPWAAYGQSKTADSLLAVGVTRRWDADGIVANAVMPGGIMTGLQQHVPAETRAEWAKVPDLKTPEQGAATVLLAAVHPSLAGVGGLYLEDGRGATVVPDDAEAPGHAGVREWALDPVAADRLWDAAQELVDGVE